jgi:uncharacterized protein YceK
MKNLYLILFLFISLVLSGCSSEMKREKLMEIKGSGNYLIQPQNNKKSREKEAITSCSCPGFNYTLGTGLLATSYHASACSASCPAPRFASCSCRIASYQVAGAYYNSCRCR